MMQSVFILKNLNRPKYIIYIITLAFNWRNQQEYQGIDNDIKIILKQPEFYKKIYIKINILVQWGGGLFDYG